MNMRTSTTVFLHNSSDIDLWREGHQTLVAAQADPLLVFRDLRR